MHKKIDSDLTANGFEATRWSDCSVINHAKQKYPHSLIAMEIS